MASAWGQSWGKSWGSAFGALLVVVEQPQQGGGDTPRTSRNSDGHAYDPDRVRDRLRSISINGKEYDPFDVHLPDILESVAREPIKDDEHPTAKLDRSFVVRTGTGDIKVPMFRPILDELPNLKTALAKDILAYADRAREEIEDERRRIVLLLLDS